MNISIQNLNKVYGNNYQALTDVNLNIEPGMFGLLGPNGAGKSTLMKILVTLLSPSTGEIMVNGMPLSKNRKEVRSMIGYLPQDFRFFAKLKTYEFLDYAASLAGITSRKERRNEVEKLLEQVGLYEVRNRYANKLSGGMKRRLGIAQAIVGDPKMVIVDEPTTGLDPEERIRFRNILTDLSQRDVIIILSTHIVGDISSTCTQMALLNEGKIGFKGSPNQFLEMSRGKVWRTHVNFDLMEEFKQKYPVITTIPDAKGYEVELIAPNSDDFEGLSIEPNLEHAYVYFMEYVAGQEKIMQP
ncbi:ABC transporter ATP-binding protein [Saccharicrinis fermentans]|uniref:Putative ABC transporter ATP-binding protein YbhF n=1 Tax=Saccharicrinis fermentans DSM 9555 = JCM 21142 TaxID=869213 RepID=W7YCY0_9BACT|nr:ABC transporter ATP-binding protein [Saccharicrinis fermentans]GAF02311.1 putative ABC transporter ATP-binding protein YbhF [Saccharicrinis fermentans DSM 9555 = JCM 21142]